jgi:hypothetical protein
MVYSFAVVLEGHIVRILEPVIASTSDELLKKAVEWLRLFPAGSLIVVYEQGRAVMSVGPPYRGQA